MRPRPERLLDYREYPILFVDDESENLRVFELAFRREFHVATAHSGEEALRLLHEMPAAVILSDQRMPGLSGVEFLERVRDLDPKTVRILVTAYGDAETLRDAINNGSIYRYLAKPWRADEMRLTLRNAIEVYALDRERDELVRELAILNRVSQSLNQELEPERVLQLLLRASTEELEYDGATILLFDAARDELGVAACAPADGDVARGLAGVTIPCRQANAFVRRLAHGQIEHWTSGDLLELAGPVRRFAAEIAAEEMLIVPLIGRDGILGALAVDNRRGGRGFRASDRTLLGGLAAQASTALENARLVEDLRRSQDRVARVDRLETLGRLVTGAVQALAEPLCRLDAALPEGGAGAPADLAEIRETLATVSELAGGASTAGEPEAWDVLEVTRELVRALGPDGERVDTDASGGSAVPKVFADRIALERLLRCLLRGLLGLAPEEARLTLRVRGSEATDVVVLELEPTGPGLDPERLEGLFAPLGAPSEAARPGAFDLLLAHELVARRGGAMQVTSGRPGEALVRVTLPAEPPRVDPYPAE